ncbi:lipid asymmetry maintenance protein MlaB [Sodalis sp. CWE]|uniref:lipid asymmetry maintenance protein MlaB n=1 Tax=Sodalis sp. CWE TaxID=2803816 RepID=UPI001C7D3C08|nr:lipid asymmetry maintenance protein MlaB [Sodalis sp. CWE]MBX4180840.1 lipid asymmetry maintenance protein MlaB [Sodalis sp. CWE]
MSEKLSWYTKEKTLVLQGELGRDTLLSLWRKRLSLLRNIYFLDVSNLNHIDSAGMALMLHFYHHQRLHGRTLALIGITDKLYTLVLLYKLQMVLPFRQIKCTDNLSLKKVSTLR